MQISAIGTTSANGRRLASLLGLQALLGEQLLMRTKAGGGPPGTWPTQLRFDPTEPLNSSSLCRRMARTAF